MKPYPQYIAVLVLISAILVVLVGKFVNNTHDPNGLLYAYGIVATTGILILFTVRFFFYRDPYVVAQERFAEDPSLRLSRPMVSIMVAAHNEAPFIESCVESLDAQTYPDREIIVVNDASTDGTRTVLERYRDRSRIQIHHLAQNVGKKRALAHAMLHAQGSIFVFTDSDTVMAPDAVEKVVDVFRTHPDVGGISGHSRAYNADTNLLTRIQDTWYEGQFSVRKAYESVFGAVTCVSGPLAAFRREAVFNLIPLWINDRFLGQEFKFATDRTKTALVLANPHFHKKARELHPDSSFVTREYHEPRDWKVVYCMSAWAYTKVPESFRSFLRQQIRWKKSFLRNMWLTGAFYWKKPAPAALMYYLRGMFVLVGPFIVFRHLFWLPVNGNLYSAALYVSGILFVGIVFALAHKLQRPWENGWVYRPLMNFLSTFVLSWLVFYSAFTIRRMVWHRG